MVYSRIRKGLLFAASLLAATIGWTAGPYWDVKPATWTTGAYLSYPIALKGPRPLVDVRAYGATGDGTTNDLTSIQNAIAASTAAGGGIVYFPPGTYSINNQILVPSSVTLQGAGMSATTIYCSTNFASGRDIIHLGPNDSQNYTDTGGGINIEVRDMHLDGTNMPTGVGYGIAAFGVDFFTADHVKISSTQSYGLVVEGTSGSTNMKSPLVQHCYFHRCGRNGGSDSLGGGYNSNARYLFNTFENCYGTAIDNVNVTRALWMGNRSINNSYGTGSLWSDFSMSDSQIVNNYIEGGSIHVFGNLGVGLGGGPNNVTISFNHLKNSSSGAILVSPSNAVSTDTARVEGLKIIGNLIEGATDYAINVGDAPGCIIANNHIIEWDAGGSGAAAINLDAGVVPTVGSTRCVVSGNAGIYGNSTLWYRENASASQAMNNQIFGNYFPGGTYTLVTTTPKSTYMQAEDGKFGLGGAGSGSPAAYLDVRGTGTSNILAISSNTSGAPTAFLVSNAGNVTAANNVTISGALGVTGTSTLGTTNAGALSATSVTDSGLTSGRVPYATTGGLLTDSANMVFTGTNLGLGGTPNFKFEVVGSSIALGQGGTNNAAIGRYLFCTGSSDDRCAYIEGFRGADAATIDIRFGTYNGDGDKGQRMILGSAGGLQMGSPTGGDKGAGTINVAADIYKNNTAYTNPDYALEHWATGRISRYAQNSGASRYKGRLPINRLDRYMRRHYQLPGVSATSGIFERSDIILEKIEEAFTYIVDLSKKIDLLEKQLKKVKSTKGK